MPPRCSAMAVTGPATPPPTIRTLVMTLPRTASRQVLGKHATDATGRRHHPKVPIRGVLGSRAPVQAGTNVLSETQAARATGAVAAPGRGRPPEYGWPPRACPGRG